MMELLQFDGQLERYSRGLDTWVPLDSDASFAAMKRSIDVQRKNRDAQSKPRVLLRIIRKDRNQKVPEVILVPSINPITSDTESFTTPQPSSDSTKMTFRPFARDSAP